MKQVHGSMLWSWCLTVLFVIITTSRPARSQPNDRNGTLFAVYCSQYKGMNEEYLSRNINTTLSSLHRKLSVNHYATARSLLNGDSVWGLASCRGYVSNADCLACFDYAAVQLRTCGFANGGYIFYDDCDIRYENYNFYAEVKVRTGELRCNNVSSSTQQAEFRKIANALLSDLRIAVPRTSNFYAASMRRIDGGNATVYAIGQCNLNISQSGCVECMDTRYTALDGCLPSSLGRSMDRGCFMKYSTTPFFRQDQITNIKPLLWDDNSSKKAIIGGVVGGVCFLLVVLAFFLWRLRSKNLSSHQLDKSTGSTVLLQGPTRYSYDDLRKATNDFSDHNKLGGGVFGEVYKGTLKNGDTVAIKKTVMTSSRGNIQIDEELKIICNVHHRHIIRLVGYCSKGPFLFLIHEYMDNGSLDNFLYGESTHHINDWSCNYHNLYFQSIVKKHFTDRESGYVAPEYAIHGQLSEKVDTYSFGIVVLEIISGKRCNNVKDEESVNQSLLDHAWNLYDSGTHLSLVDDTLDPSEYREEEAKKIIEIALMCTQSPVSSRPAMSEVVTLISDRSLDQIPPVRSTFHEDDVKIDVDRTLTSLSSNATGSTVEFSGQYKMGVMAVLVMFHVLLLIKPGTSQRNDTENNINTLIRSFCGRNPPKNLPSFINYRNSTFAEIRRQLSSNGVFYARAQSLSEGDSVFGLAQCRNYLSAAQCVACLDAGVSELDRCLTGNGAYTFFDNCFVRYANYDNFYNDPNVVEDAGIGPLGICGNQSASQPTTTFTQEVRGMLSDITYATPKTSNFYVASTTQITSNNAMVYAIGQCVENINKDICQSCIDNAYTSISSCLPNTEATFISMGCFTRYSVTPFFNDNQTVDITNLLKEDSSKVPVIAGAAAGAGLDSPELKRAINYNYKDLQLATNNFSEENILGKGGFGEVFKAVLEDNIVAVKKIEVFCAKPKANEEFENEVKLISSVRHRNLLRLLGWSSEVSNLLVLEYMPNGSLDRFLWGSSSKNSLYANKLIHNGGARKGTLNWIQRYDIIFGIARGLAYLHNEFYVKIVHRDIKSSNILLDHDFQPKIADFGLARFHPEDKSHISTQFAGTLGYTAPEYALHGHLSDKVDTYSFGIVVLEIVSGRRCTDVNSDEPSMNYLLEHAWKLYENKKHVILIDEAMDVNEHEEHVMKIIQIALMCTQTPASKRPVMSEVVSMLPKGLSMQNRQLARPTLIDHGRQVHIKSPNKRIVYGTLKELDGKLQLQGVDDEADVMEKGMNVQKHW
ncbi:LOW QUALITY PROTEIN: hypothetical protein M8C21_006395 [Ambrosia artemisiifolia]|uniref:Cysteine-rich receptor-like protein kinase 2 n=1 Tax=Ambrosia artemisiifolia TaxID=4212 RepID=A0AAD5G1T2_AMBAR|nr:LOW QUALITY PROTEIN: hypothetical protein M8C21_006395 [Ambrosia artemisiifolia]